jgi:multiple sugar transport system permease protein
LCFIGPNLIGFATFTLFPLVLSLVMAMTNWDLSRHNMFRDEPLRFVGFEHIVRLVTEPDFARYLGNTLFLMMGIPFGVAGSLGAAMLLSQDLRGSRKAMVLRLIVSLVLVVSVAVLAAMGAGIAAIIVLLLGVVAAIQIGGNFGGQTVYRTVFYLPHITAGVATFLLWKKLYSPHSGPINAVLAPLLDGLSRVVANTPPGLWWSLGWLLLLLGVVLTGRLLGWLVGRWRDAEVGLAVVGLTVLLVLVPWVVGLGWGWLWTGEGGSIERLVLVGLLVVVLLYNGWRALGTERPEAIGAPRPTEGFGDALMLSLGVMVGLFVLIGLTAVVRALPGMVADADALGLAPPNWLNDYHWAKPSLMIMAFWSAVGSNNMLLYLAGLSNIPQELYEAADIDGARRFQRFWHVTWPQLAPVTFFILIMSTIAGLQGGFEMARAMTQGGPAGATTTLSYYIYIEGFETGKLGFASAVAWALFLLIFTVTLINWRFGNRYVND